MMTDAEGRRPGDAMAMHDQCVGCLSRERTDETAEDATMALLAMLLGGHTPEELEADLCFMHKRHARDAASAVRSVIGIVPTGDSA